MNFVQCTTLSGTIAFVCYWICSRMFRLSPANRYLLLKINLIFFLIPFSLIWSLIRKYMPAWYFRQLKKKEVLYLSPYKTIYHTDTGVVYPFEFYPVIWKLIYIISAVLILVIFFFFLRKYMRTRRILNTSGRAIKHLELFEKCQEEVKIKRKMSLIHLPLECSAFTFGIMRPILVLTKPMPEEKLYYILMHELYHIKSYDVLFQSLTKVAVLLHFYNPFVYLFMWEMRNVCELSCDAKVLQNVESEQRLVYGELLIEQSEKKIPKQFFASHMFAQSNYRLLKERIIMCKRSFLSRKIMTFIASVCICGLAAIPLSMYMVPVEASVNNVEGINSNTEIVIGKPLEWMIGPEEENFAQADVFFKNSSGEISFPIEDSSQSQTRSCKHTYVAATKNIHSLKNNGGCTIQVYNVRKCTECDYYIRGSLVSQASYTKCPHK